MAVINPVNFQAEGINLTGQLYLPEQAFPAVICICHGIPSGKPRDPADGGYPVLAEKLCSRGFAAFIFNFRGCGDSGGNLDMSGWSRDLKAAVDYLCSRQETKGHYLALLGFSGGAAVSIYNAAHDERVSSVTSCASPAEFDFKGAGRKELIEHFRSIGAIRDPGFPTSVDEWHEGFEMVSPIKHVARISPRPLLIVHGLKDETVDITHAYRLYSLAGELKYLSIIRDAGHRLRRDQEAMEAVLDWLNYLYVAQETGADFIDPPLEADL